jgi:uncharacterized LabA/DUF88 family protein
VQRRGVRVTVVSTISSQPPIVADELRRQADDEFTDLTELLPRIGRDPPDRAPPREGSLHSVQYVNRRTKGGRTTGSIKG